MWMAEHSGRKFVVGALVLVSVGFLGVRIGEAIAARRAVAALARSGQPGARQGMTGGAARAGQPGGGQFGGGQRGPGQAGARPSWPGQGGRGEAVSVQVEPVGKGPVEEAVVLSGSLEPQYQVDVFSRRAGRLSRVIVKEGQRVRVGDPLFSVDHSDLLLQEQQAVAGLAASRANYRKAEAQRDKIAGDLERVKLLYDQRASTQQELRNVTDQLHEAEMQLEVAKAQLGQAEANLAMVKLQLDQVNTAATVSGVVIRTFGVAGSQVTTTAPVATLAGLDPIEVAFAVAEKDIGRLRVGQDFSLSVDAFPGETFRGKITSLGAVVEASTRTLPVRGRVANPELRLRPGMFARVDLVVGQKANVLTVPREALLSRSDGFYVFVVADGIAEARPVKIGVQGKERVEILDGLAEGDPVAVVGQQQLRDGQAVRAVSSSALASPYGPGASRRAPAVRHGGRGR